MGPYILSFPCPSPRKGGRPKGSKAKGSGSRSSHNWSLSLRACSQGSISLHWFAATPMHCSHRSCLVQVLHARQTECGSHPLRGQNWEQSAERAPSSMTRQVCSKAQDEILLKNRLEKEIFPYTYIYIIFTTFCNKLWENQNWASKPVLAGSFLL